MVVKHTMSCQSLPTYGCNQVSTLTSMNLCLCFIQLYLGIVQCMPEQTEVMRNPDVLGQLPRFLVYSSNAAIIPSIQMSLSRHTTLSLLAVIVSSIYPGLSIMLDPFCPQTSHFINVKWCGSPSVSKPSTTFSNPEDNICQPDVALPWPFQLHLLHA